MFCSQCGNSVAEGSRFCSSCGTAVAGSATSSGAASAGVQGPSPAFGKTFGHESNPTFRFDVRRWGLGVNADRKGARAPVENGSTLSLKLLGDLSLVHRLAA